jgi:hypothetical protein
VEDSYAPGHVKRDDHELIQDVFIWDDANKKPDPSRGWDGHSAYDNPANTTSAPHFQAARYTVQDVILCVLLNGEKTEGDFQAALKGVISQRFARSTGDQAGP